MISHGVVLSRIKCAIAIVRKRRRRDLIDRLNERPQISTVSQPARVRARATGEMTHVRFIRAREFEESRVGCDRSAHRQYIKRASIQSGDWITRVLEGDKNILFPGILSTSVLYALRITADRVLSRIIRSFVEYISSGAYARARHLRARTYAHVRIFFRICTFTARTHICTQYLGKGTGPHRPPPPPPPLFFSPTRISFADLAIFLVEFTATHASRICIV